MCNVRGLASCKTLGMKRQRQATAGLRFRALEGPLSPIAERKAPQGPTESAQGLPVINKAAASNRQGEHWLQKHPPRRKGRLVDARGWFRNKRRPQRAEKEAAEKMEMPPRAPSPENERPYRPQGRVPNGRTAWRSTCRARAGTPTRTPSPTSGVARRRGSCGRPTRPSLSAPVHKQNFAALLTPSTRRLLDGAAHPMVDLRAQVGAEPPSRSDAPLATDAPAIPPRDGTSLRQRQPLSGCIGKQGDRHPQAAEAPQGPRRSVPDHLRRPIQLDSARRGGTMTEEAAASVASSNKSFDLDWAFYGTKCESTSWAQADAAPARGISCAMIRRRAGPVLIALKKYPTPPRVKV